MFCSIIKKIRLVLLLTSIIIGCETLYQSDLSITVNNNNTIDILEMKAVDINEFEPILEAQIARQEDKNKIIKIALRIQPQTSVSFVKKVKESLSYYRENTRIQLFSPTENTYKRTVKLPLFYTKEKPDISKLNPRNVARIHLYENGQINYRGQNILFKDLADSTYVFLKSDTTKKHLPQLKIKNLNKVGKVLCAAKTIINLTADENAKYLDYESAYEEIYSTYQILWNEYSERFFNKRYDKLKNWEQEIIRIILPFVLSET